MSLSVNQNITPLVCVDPRLIQNPNYEYIIKKGGSFYSWFQVNANNFGPSSSTFSFNSPSVKNIIDKSIDISYIVDFHFVGVNPTPGTNLINLGVSDGPKFKPLNNVLFDTSTLTMNGNAVTVYNKDILPVLSRTNYDEELRRHWLSTTPSSIMDQHQNYEDISDVTYPYFSQYSMNNNEVGQYGQGGLYGDGRGSFRYISRTKISDNEEIIRYEFVEPLMISPCIDTDKWLQMGFYGINTIQLVINHNARAISNGAMWSHNSILGNTITSIETSIVSAQLRLHVINPPDTYIPYDGILSYKYDRFDRYISPVGPIAAGGKVVGFTANAITLPIFPSRIYIVARRSTSDMDFNTTDTYAFLENINITLKSKNGIIASANPQQLYELSLQQGLKLSWSQWSRDVGSVMIVPIEYCSLDDTEAAAVQEQLQLQIRADITNLNLKKLINFEFVIIIANPGLYNIEPATQAINTNLGIVTKSDVLNASLSPHVDYHLIREMYGGDLTSDIKAFGQKLSAFANKAAPYVKRGTELAVKYGPQVVNAVKNAATYAPELAALVGLGGDMEGGKRRKRRARR